MNSIQNYGISKNNAIMFRASTKPICEAVEKAAGKSGIYQAAVDKLATLQRELEYGCSLLRLNNWFNPANVRESDKAIYEMYQSKIKNLKQKKKEVIDGMLKQIREDARYKDLSEDCMKRIEEHIDCGSTWSGFYFNDESISKIIANKM